MIRWAGILGASLLAALGAVPSPASAAGWQPAVSAEAGDRAGFVAEVGTGADGEAVAAWARHVSDIRWEIVASSRPRGGRWSAPLPISGETRTGEILRAKVAVDPDGHAVVVWAARPPEAWGNENVFKALWSASRSPSGAWSAPQEIATASGVNEFNVVIDAGGTATAIWHSLLEGDDDPPGSFVRAASHPLGGEWSDPVELSGPANGSNPEIAVNPAGNLTAVWIGADPGTGNFVVRSKSRPAGEPWSATAEDVSDDAGNATDVQVSVDSSGNAVAAWPYSTCQNPEECEAYDACTDAECREGLDVSRYHSVQAASRSESSGTWGAPEQLWDDPADERAPEVALATGPDGSTTALWSSYAPGGNTMLSSTRSPGPEGLWGAPGALSTPDGGSLLGSKPTNPRIAVDPQGGATATWSAAVGPNPGLGITENRRLQATHRPAAGPWETPVSLSGVEELWSASVAADPEGYVTALWVGGSGVTSRVYDAIAPILGSLTVPAAGKVGEPIAMSVEPFDVWSTVRTGWDFGDGGSATGSTVGHCYATPGERAVTITGADLAANTASASRTIDIEADPAAGPDPCHPPTIPDIGPDTSTGADASGSTGTDPRGGGSPKPLAPVLSNLRQASNRWRTRALRRGPALPVGTTFRFHLNRAARVRLSFARLLPGGRARPRGTLRMPGETGPNVVRFSGRLRGFTLGPGRYRLTVTAEVDGAASATESLGFSIVR